MSLKNHYKSPFQVLATEEGGLFVVADSRSLALCSDVTHSEGVELCSILNAHFQPKEEPEPKGICGKCLTTHTASHIGYKCDFTKCDGTVQDIHTPQPNREETDRVAMEFIKSRRKLEVQCWSCGQWVDVKNKSDDVPHFDYALPWRIKPKRRRVVVEVYRLPHGSLVSHIKENGKPGKFWTLLGTAECEVEA